LFLQNDVIVEIQLSSMLCDCVCFAVQSSQCFDVSVKFCGFLTDHLQSASLPFSSTLSSLQTCGQLTFTGAAVCAVAHSHKAKPSIDDRGTRGWTSRQKNPEQLRIFIHQDVLRLGTRPWIWTVRYSCCQYWRLCRSPSR